MIKMQNKWFLSLSIAMVIGLVYSSVSYGMEPEQSEPKDELSVYFENLPGELRYDIRRLQLMKNAVVFLGLYDLQRPITILAGREYEVSSIATSDDKVVTGGSTIKIWDINSGKLLHTLPVHANYVRAVAISGDIVVTGLREGTAQIWKIDTNPQLLWTLNASDFIGYAGVQSVAISGDTVITGSHNTEKVWSVKTGKLIRDTWHHHINSIATYGDKMVIGSTDEAAEMLHESPDNTVGISSIKTGQLLRKLEGHADDVEAVAISEDKVVTGSRDGIVKIWDLNTGALLHTLERHKDEIKSVAVAGNKVVTSDKTAKIWDANTGRLVRILDTNKIFSVAISGSKVITASYDGTAKIWPLSINLQGTSDNNPLVWIVEKATIPQLDLINRAYRATIIGQEFIIAFPSEDAKVMLSFPAHVKQYLLQRLNIKLNIRR